MYNEITQKVAAVSKLLNMWAVGFSSFSISGFNRGADPRARWMGAGLPADIRRAQSGQVPCSDAQASANAKDCMRSEAKILCPY